MSKVDVKGKYYTERMSKHSVDVIMITAQCHYRGLVHVLPGQRVKDLLNNPNEQFIAITHATLTYGNRQEEVDFIALNKHHIISVVPLNEPGPSKDDEDYIPY